MRNGHLVWQPSVWPVQPLHRSGPGPARLAQCGEQAEGSVVGWRPWGWGCPWAVTCEVMGVPKYVGVLYIGGEEHLQKIIVGSDSTLAPTDLVLL